MPMRNPSAKKSAIACAGTKKANASRVADYYWRESGKWKQKQVPPGFEDVGRFWGIFGRKSNFKPHVYTREVDYQEYVSSRRQGAVLRDRQAGKKVQKPRGLDGLWTLAADGFATGVQLLRWAEGQAEPG